MTLKGGMLMAATSARRMTKDADLATIGVANEEAAIASVVSEIIAVALDDGLAFNETTIRTEPMREDADYHGVRVKLEASWRGWLRSTDSSSTPAPSPQSSRTKPAAAG